ncbi:IclR family transcriptional regulator [Dietzia sp. B32]|uniref:IclR family transcriptional regulator n=1 Tax=Dietzia sp. B32 TaxID=2915130 RepID=UPI0021ADA186|nr:IclR family transcriptional regulator [Dietzia sp. B32]UVE93826.1 IclR family transcriptional regulator [Dietzia sp. B32]
MTEPLAGASAEHRTVSRVAGILEFVSRSDQSVRLTDIVAELSAPRSSVHGLVHGLVSTGYLSTTDDGRYIVGPALPALLLPKTGIDHAIRAEMEGLSLEFDETVTLVALAGDSIVTTDAVESAKEVRYSPAIGTRRPLYPTSAGRCFLANAQPSYRDRFLERAFPLPAERDRVSCDLQRVRDEGLAVNRGDTLSDLHAVSAPIFDGRTVAGVLTIAGPSARFVERLDDLSAAVREATGRLSRSSSG